MELGRQRGQAAVEGIGVTVLVALLVAATGAWLLREAHPPPPPPVIVRTTVPGGIVRARSFSTLRLTPGPLISIFGGAPDPPPKMPQAGVFERSNQSDVSHSARVR